ncbi:hypothetical protein C1645_767552 [Glomus cerebriforme]|uniref:C-CAP/cofactor C-like domain-containing protein n=1 Tax=Glomus cerebriforme TaxID=658196 RepID=A0A397T0N2_9GLOM|nr:hypothetical protein C1645_767552 [Glomus cerebriforme]
MQQPTQIPNSTPALVGQLLNQRKFFEQENSQVKHLDNTSISSNSTVYLRLCENMEYVVDCVCTKIMIEECKNLKLTVNDKIITSIIEVWKSDNVNLNLNSQVQTVQIDQCNNINLNYSNPNYFHSVVWAITTQLSFKIFENGQEKHIFNDGNDKQNLTSDNNTEEPSKDKHLNPEQYIVRLIDNQLVTEELVRAENWFPTTRREWGEWKAKVNANEERERQRRKEEAENKSKGNENDANVNNNNEEVN